MQCFEVMRKLVGQEINELERMYALEVDTLLMENNLVCKTGRTHYTSQNIAVIKDKIRKNQRIPNNNQFVVLTNSLCDKMEQLISENTYEICTLICGLSKFWGNSKDMLLNTKRTAGFAFSQAFKHKSLAVELNTSSGRKIVNQLYDSNNLLMQTATTLVSCNQH